MAPGYSCAARSMETAARVRPRSRASLATSGSAMKQRRVQPKASRLGLLMPAFAILVSVTMGTPRFSAAWPSSAAPGVKRRLFA